MTTANDLPVLELLPAVDVVNGQAVRLVQGEAGSETSYGTPLEAALNWQQHGAEWVHLVDLDAAFGRGSNAELLREVVGRLDIKVELSGGLRDDETLEKALDLGVARVNLGTAALENPEWTRRAIDRFGDKIAVGLDVRGTTLAGRGWTKEGGDLWEVLERLEAAGCARYVVTDVTKDGTLQGPNVELLRQMVEKTGKPVVASGGISSLDDLKVLRSLVPLGVEGAIVGKALYAGAFTFPRPSTSPAAGKRAAVESGHRPEEADGPGGQARPAPRHLPGHIAAALAGAGGTADSAGQPWAGRSLAGADAKIHNFEDDDGTADAAYLAAVDGLRSGSGDEAAVVASLHAARVFVPIVAQLAEEAEGAEGLQADKQADMALVTLKAPDGRTAMPVFTSAAAMEAWHPSARPVAVYAARAALSAVAEGAELLVVDPGSDLTFVVRRPAVWALAQQRPWVPSYADQELAKELEESVTGHPAVRRIELLPGAGVRTATGSGVSLPGGGPGPELRVVLYLEDGLDAAGVQSVVAGLNTAWTRNELFVERVDSIEVKLKRAAG